jgi:Ala-tRNA(Pro) deacylase
MSTSTFLQIKELLDSKKIEYTHLTHEHVQTSEDAARIRGTRLEDAAKALICKVQDTGELIQAILPANERLDLKKLKIILNTKNISLASPEEVLERTGCTIGSVPPFGILWKIRMFLDEELLKRDLIVFSAGTHNDSIQLKAEDYYSALNPIVVEMKK